MVSKMCDTFGRRRRLSMPKFPNTTIGFHGFSLRRAFKLQTVFVPFLSICLVHVVIYSLPISALNVGSYYLPSPSATPRKPPTSLQQQFDFQRPFPGGSSTQYRTSLPSNSAHHQSILTAKLLSPHAHDFNNNTSFLSPPVFDSLYHHRKSATAINDAEPALSAAPIVRTTSGRLVGRLARADNGAVVALYLGVPFAKPPIGELRFRKPEHFVSPPHALLNVTSFAPLCGAIKIMPNAFKFVVSQNTTSSSHYDREVDANRRKPPSSNVNEQAQQVSEDCLYLNVYVPASAAEASVSTSEVTRVPVMVWIPGGDWNSVIGSQDQIDAVQFAAKTGAIVVSINYRVGLFGFLTSNDKALPGNYGLYDQAMAIGWVRQNIDHFGGNSKEITLFGHSSGAMSISWHLFSGVMRSGNESIFKRAILQSGAYIGDLSLSLTENSATFTNELGTRLNCQTDSSLILADCLRRVPEEALRRASHDIAPFGLGPVVDGEYIDDDPFNMLYAARQQQDGGGGGVKINAKDIMIGTVFDEGSLALEILPLLTVAPQSFMQNGLNQSEFDNLARLFLVGWLPQHRSQPQIYDLIVHKYKNFRTGPEAMHARRQNFMDLVGDVLINMGVDLLAEKLSESGVRVFAYQFQHRPSWSQYPMFIKAGHGDELPFVFGNAHDMGAVTAESSLSARMTRAWAQFAASGDPNPLEPYAALSQTTTWLPYGPMLRHYYAWNLQLRSEKALQQDLRAADIEFWYNVRARLGNFIQQCQVATESSTATPMQMSEPKRVAAVVASTQQPTTTLVQSSWPNNTANVWHQQQHQTYEQQLPQPSFSAPPTAAFAPKNGVNLVEHFVRRTELQVPSPRTDIKSNRNTQNKSQHSELASASSEQQMLRASKSEPQPPPFYQLPPPSSSSAPVAKKYPVANLKASNSTTTTTTLPPPSILDSGIPSASFLQTLPAAVTTFIPATVDDPSASAASQSSGMVKNLPPRANATPWQSSHHHQYNVIKRLRTNPDSSHSSSHQVRASLHDAFSTTAPPAAAGEESGAGASMTVVSTDSNVGEASERVSSSKVNAHAASNITAHDVDTVLAGIRPEEQPLSPRPHNSATAAADVIAAVEMCAETGWLIGSEISTQQAEIIIGALGVFSLTSLVLIVLLCFAVTGQRRKLRRRKFLLAADPKSASTTLYANHQQQHHQHRSNNNSGYHYQ